MSNFSTLFVQELKTAIKNNLEMLQPLLFCLLVATLFPLGISPGPEILQKIGPGAIWVAAILASLLGMEKMFKADFDSGWLEQIILSDTSLSGYALVKSLVHWLLVIMPILLVSPLLALFFNLTIEMYWALIGTLLIGTPILTLVGAIAVAITLSLERGGVLISLLLLPIFVPLLIFATAAVNNAALQLNYLPHLGIIGAMLLFALALAPPAISYSLKVSHH
ncbi:MAG: heme exporter protein CcmB [Aestuariibacter sp.]